MTQANLGNYCKATMPDPKPWGGDPVGPAGPLEAWVLWPNFDKESIEKSLVESTDRPGEWLAALVDNETANVVSAFLLSDDEVTKFAGYIINGRIGGPGIYPPPDPCRVPQLCAPVLAAYGQTLQLAADGAIEAALSCQKY